MEDRRFLHPLVLFLRTRLCGLGELGECEGQADLLNATLVRPPTQHQQGPCCLSDKAFHSPVSAFF